MADSSSESIDTIVTSKLKKVLVICFKIYIFITIALSLSCHAFVTFKFTLNENGGIVSLIYLVANVMQFLLIFDSEKTLPLDTVTNLLKPSTQQSIRRNRAISGWSIFALVTLFVLSLLFFVSFNGPTRVFLKAYGCESSHLKEPLFVRIFLLIAFNNTATIMATSLTFFSRYLMFLYYICLLARQNVAFVDSFLMQSGPPDVTYGTLKRIEQLYLQYKELVDKLNVAYSMVPLWSLINLYTHILALGTMLIIFHGKRNALGISIQCAFFLVAALVFTILLVQMCKTSHTLMETFRQKALKLTNCQMERRKRWDPAIECLANTLKGIPLVKMQAAQMYDMEPSIVISLIASAIPMTVMVVSLLRELK